MVDLSAVIYFYYVSTISCIQAGHCNLIVLKVACLIRWLRIIGLGRLIHDVLFHYSGSFDTMTCRCCLEICSVEKVVRNYFQSLQDKIAQERIESLYYGFGFVSVMVIMVWLPYTIRYSFVAVVIEV